jgi:hypothetical protein
MKNFTLIKTKTFLAILMFAVFSSAAFGQLKKVNVPSVVITFQVDMTYQIEKGEFNPFLDTLDLPGTMNGWAGTQRLTPVGSTKVYEYVYTLDSNTVVQYKYRINGSMETAEFPNGGPNRMYRVPNHPDTVKCFYNDYNPATVPMTFKCNMSYQLKMGRFDKVNDYVDFASEINNWGGDYDVLFDRGNDSIYEFNINVDTSYILNQPKIQYKYRINGDWNNAEIGTERIARVQDTINGFINVIEVWYNDQDPSIPAAPFAYNVAIQGNLAIGQTITGSYTYEDVNSDPEGESIYRWFTADSITQVIPDTIPGILAVNYVIAAADSGKYIVFEVMPVAASGIPLMGDPVRTWSGTKVINTSGIEETRNNSIRFYPNPVSDFITLENLINIEKIEIFSLVGQKVFTLNDINTEKITINASNLKAGVYFIKFYSSDKGTSTLKFIKT